MYYDHLSYFLSVLLFAGIPAVLEFILGFHLVKPFFGKLVKLILGALVLTPIMDSFAFAWRAWIFPPEKNLGIVIFGDVLETYIFTFFIVCAISIATVIWSDYEDRGLPIIKTSIKDVLSGKYAIWRKQRQISRGIERFYY